MTGAMPHAGPGKGVGHALVRVAIAAPVAMVLAVGWPALPMADEFDEPIRDPVSNPLGEGFETAPDAPMLLEAERLVYDYDNDRVSAVGAVEIFYLDYSLTADRVDYDQRSGRLTAKGNVRIIEPRGNVIHAEEIDLTDDFRDGFLKSLSVRTTEQARFAAQSAERQDGNRITFNRGVYTACEPCRDHPERPPFWQIKAATIVHDAEEQTVYYEDATLEIMGVPVAYWPYFFHPDPEVSRKTGFLAPSLTGNEAVGLGLQTPYFVNLAPNYDITFTPTVYSRQGLLGEAEWRHRRINGAYNVHLAGIFQLDKGQFVDGSGDELSGYRTFRGSIQSTGSFAINSQWQWGWDIFASTDRTFGRDYNIANELDIPSSVYLTGMSDQNFFDIRGMAFRVQRENTVEVDQTPAGPPYSTYTHDDQKEQAIVHPVADHNYIFDQPFLGGELSLDSNVTSLSRLETDIRKTPVMDYYAGVAGTFTRASTDLSWQKRIVTIGGQIVTPFAYLKGEINFSGYSDPDVKPVDDNRLFARAMPAGGIQYEWPFLAQSEYVTQTFGPVAQLIVRPNETNVGKIANEDAQSLVFDDTNLLEWDKFSGYDRMEGGTRANLGFTYQARLMNGLSVDAIVGQSFHLAGKNSFELDDPALAGSDSGLDKSTSDIVGRVTIDSGRGFSMTARGRLNEEDFSLERAEVRAAAFRGDSSAELGYAFVRSQPVLGILEDRSEIRGAAQVALSDNWSVSGSVIYDLENASRVGHSFGLSYDNDCFNLEASYSQTFDRYNDTVEGRSLFLRLNFRTITDGTVTRSLSPN